MVAKKDKKPRKQESPDLSRYRQLVAELRLVRSRIPRDEDEEDRILDQMGVVWLRLSEWDRKMLNRQFDDKGRR